MTSLLFANVSSLIKKKNCIYIRSQNIPIHAIVIYTNNLQGTKILEFFGYLRILEFFSITWISLFEFFVNNYLQAAFKHWTHFQFFSIPWTHLNFPFDILEETHILFYSLIILSWTSFRAAFRRFLMNYEDHNANGACAFAAHRWFDLVTLPWLAQLFYRVTPVK